MRIGLIATSSLSRKAILGDSNLRVVPTRYGDVPVETGSFGDDEVILMSRAGVRHPLEPGRVNYRANILAMRELGVDCLLSTCVVGSLRQDLEPGTVATLGQFLDFTRHRAPTLFDEHGFGFTDMTEPYCPRLRGLVGKAAADADFPLAADMCYVGVDGPRYETAAEVRMFRLLGGEVIGHTGVTEAVMAREAGLCHASLVLVSNYAAGMTTRPISNQDVSHVRELHADRLERMVTSSMGLLRQEQLDGCGCAGSVGGGQLPTWSQALTPVTDES